MNTHVFRGEYTTPGAKGKYYKSGATDGRTGSGPRQKNMKSLAGIPKGMRAAGVPNRTFASDNKGPTGKDHLKLRSVAHGIAESKRTIYNELERVQNQSLLIEQKLEELKEDED